MLIEIGSAVIAGGLAGAWATRFVLAGHTAPESPTSPEQPDAIALDDAARRIADSWGGQEDRARVEQLIRDKLRVGYIVATSERQRLEPPSWRRWFRR